ncbi:MAG TPA: hypothetical protein VM073_12130 [Usitatibacter sp.]|nr:hypothetical protein [Usitatibacter sp.]
MPLDRPHPFSQAGKRRDMPNPAALDVGKLLDAAKSTPDLMPLEWDGDDVRAPEAGTEDVRKLDVRRRRIRDRYIAARFPGVARKAADLAQAGAVIKAARLHFEEEETHLALELLELAAEEAPEQESLWLARLEILYLLRDREKFVTVARAFHAAHRASPEWPEVERLGRALAPGEPFFGAHIGPRAHEHYGPWPHLPNWIDAPWDLTAEIVAADFHRALRQEAP